MNEKKLFDLVLSGRSDNNLHFNDFCRLVSALGFSLKDRKGTSHRIFTHPDLPEIINLQPRGHDAKPYQVKQVRDLILRYNLSLSDHAD
jgi:predicted RNA binding protein YcfA (HicA-like mRNA interferase family)